MKVERTNTEVLVRIKSEYDSDKLQEILDLIRYAELTSKSNATQTEVNELAAEVNKSWWDKNKNHFVK